MSAELAALLTRARVLPVLTIHNAADAVPLARALSDGGLPVLEVTLRTPAALDAIGAIAREAPGVTVGAGTVLTAAALADAERAGARFAVSPGLTPALLAARRAIPLLPGVATASDIMLGLEAGVSLFKFFPAESAGGAAALASLAAPFADARFVPTGGINAANAHNYRALSSVICIGGSWMVDAAALREKRWDVIGRAAHAAAAI